LTEENQTISEEQYSHPKDGKKSKKQKRLLCITALILIILLILFGLYRCGYLGGRQENDSDIVIGAGVKEGEMNTGETEIREDGSEAGANGKANMTVKINSRPVFADGESAGDLNIVNPEANLLYMKAEIRLDDTGEVIYESGAIPPNHYIDNDKLAKVLEKGAHNAIAHVTLFDPDNPDAQYNSANFNLVITIEN